MYSLKRASIILFTYNFGWYFFKNTFSPCTWSTWVCVINIAFISFGSTPNSFNFSSAYDLVTPRSIKILVLSVCINTLLPRLPLDKIAAFIIYKVPLDPLEYHLYMVIHFYINQSVGEYQLQNQYVPSYLFVVLFEQFDLLLPT